MLKEAKTKGAAVPDSLPNRLLQNLEGVALDFVLDIFNKSWRTGDSPQCWRDAVICPILKQGKPAGEFESWRPIALTSCLAKVLERMVANRLKHLAESRGLWNPMQAGFWAQRSYEDQVMRLSQSIHDGFQCPKPAKRTVVALLDFSKAYDKVWQADVLQTILHKGIPPRFVYWIKGFLTNRQARVRF